jgi:hypothetical protein
MLRQNILRLLIVIFSLIQYDGYAQNNISKALSGKTLDDLETLYLWLHQHPELSLQETQTSKKLAAELKNNGFEVHENVGGTGIVGIFKNGTGPTVLVRADMDALPVKEETGLPYASTVKMKDAAGNEVQGWMMSPIDSQNDVTSTNPNVNVFTTAYSKLLSSKIINHSTYVETITAKATDYTTTAKSDSITVFSGDGEKTKSSKISDIVRPKAFN